MEHKFEIWDEYEYIDDADSLKEAVDIIKDLKLADDWDEPRKYKIHAIEIITDIGSVDLGDYL